MTINEKLSEIKKIIDEIKSITERMGNDNVLETQIQQMNNEISRLKKGIDETIDDLDEVLGEKDART